jgi:hypothetical protein
MALSERGPGRRHLPRFRQRLALNRTVCAVALGFGLVGACCGVFGAGEPVGLLMPAAFTLAALVGGALVVWGLSAGVGAIDAATWVVSVPRLATARSLSLAGGSVLAAGVVVTVLGLFLQPSLVTFAVLVTPVLVLVLLAPTAAAFSYARTFRQLSVWRSTTPPNAPGLPPQGPF